MPVSVTLLAVGMEKTYAPISQLEPFEFWSRVVTLLGHVDDGERPRLYGEPRFVPESMAGEVGRRVKLEPGVNFKACI